VAGADAESCSLPSRAFGSGADVISDPRTEREILRRVLPRHASCGSIARGLLEAHLVHLREDDLDDAKTIASELVNNAFLHGEGPIVLRVSGGDSTLLIEVADRGANRVDVPVRPRASGGRGLAVVAGLAHRWDVGGPPTKIWAELLLSLPAGARCAPSRQKGLMNSRPLWVDCPRGPA
jgi:anti-sigma regulatory factor (Ser/Thr protein kinase)